MEGIVSIMVFTVLIATVTTTLTVSLRISGASLEMSNEWQGWHNELVEGTVLPTGDDDIRFEFFDSDGNVVLPLFDITVDVDIFANDGFAAFEPQ